MWQNIAAIAIVMLATGYLARRSWRSIMKKRSAGCGACGDCPGGSAKPLVELHGTDLGRTDPTGKPLIQLAPLTKGHADSHGKQR